MIFRQSTSYRLVFTIWFCPDRDHRKGVIKVLTASSLLFFFWGRQMFAKYSKNFTSTSKNIFSKKL